MKQNKSPASAMASRWSRRSVLTASRACHRSALVVVIDALAGALVTKVRRPECEEQPSNPSSVFSLGIT